VLGTFLVWVVCRSVEGQTSCAKQLRGQRQLPNIRVVVLVGVEGNDFDMVLDLFGKLGSYARTIDEKVRIRVREKLLEQIENAAALSDLIPSEGSYLNVILTTLEVTLPRVDESNELLTVQLRGLSKLKSDPTLTMTLLLLDESYMTLVRNAITMHRISPGREAHAAEMVLNAMMSVNTLLREKRYMHNFCTLRTDYISFHCEHTVDRIMGMILPAVHVDHNAAVSICMKLFENQNPRERGESFSTLPERPNNDILLTVDKVHNVTRTWVYTQQLIIPEFRISQFLNTLNQDKGFFSLFLKLCKILGNVKSRPVVQWNGGRYANRIGREMGVRMHENIFYKLFSDRQTSSKSETERPDEPITSPMGFRHQNFFRFFDITPRLRMKVERAIRLMRIPTTMASEKGKGAETQVRIIGIHLRGTDKRQCLDDGHVNIMFKTAAVWAKHFSRRGFESKFFVASDDMNLVEKAHETLGLLGVVNSLDSIHRSTQSHPLHSSRPNHMIHRNVTDGLTLARDVIEDTLALSMCDVYLRQLGNVANAPVMWNPSILSFQYECTSDGKKTKNFGQTNWNTTPYPISKDFTIPSEYLNI